VDLAAAALLGVVQGLTEFLPVSSSGHLILARAFFGWDAGRYGLAFDVALHIGTFGAVVWFFRHDVRDLLAASWRAVQFKEGTSERLARQIVVGTVPAVAVVLLFGDAIENVRDPRIIAATLAIGAVGLLVADRFGRESRGMDAITYGEAFAIGCAQAAALVPGVSRSGATITIALLLGLARPAAGRFAFLLSLPVVFAAAVKEAVDMYEAGATGLPPQLFVVGVAVSGVVGYLTIKYFLRYLAHHSLAAFAVYRFVLAAVTVVWLMS
jgi:undecaprenyl-diphosphatase